MEKDKFDQAWREALAGGQAEPSPAVWGSLEHQLIAAENQAMRGAIVWYRWATAASVLLAAALGAAYVWSPSSTPEQLASTTPISVQPASVTKSAAGVQQSNSISAALLPQTNTNVNQIVTPQVRRHDEPTAVHALPGQHAPAEEVKIESDLDQLSTAMIAEVPVVLSESVRQYAVPVPNWDAIRKSRTRKFEERLWAGVQMGGGSFDPGSTNTGASLATVADVVKSGNYSGNLVGQQAGYTPTTSRGVSYGFNMAVGKRISSRLVLMGGVGYLNQQAGYASNLVLPGTLPSAFSLSYLPSLSNESVAITSPYQINSSLEYVTLPLQAGYILLDRRVGIQLNAGASTDFFFRNMVVDPSGQYATLSEGPGSHSPYRTVGWTGLLGTEVSYRFARHYRFSLVPGMRYGITNLYKSGESSGNPLRWDVGVRLRYIFNE